MELDRHSLSLDRSREFSSNKRDDSSNSYKKDSRLSANITLGVILGVVLFFIFSMMITIYCNRRNRQRAEDPDGKVSLNRLRKLEAVAPSRKLGEWWPTVKESLGMSQLVESNFVCVICFDQVDRTHEIHQLKCLHVFHKECLENWYLRGHYRCPMCQSVFFPEKERHISTAEFVLIA